jgi:type I pantothenate kinase
MPAFKFAGVCRMETLPFQHFSRHEWRRYRSEAPLRLSEDELNHLLGFNENLSIPEAEDIYLPLSRLIHLYVSATQSLHDASSAFLYANSPKVPYIVAITGSVAVGKSTTSRILQALLSRWEEHPRVSLVTTDGFLYPNQILEARGLMNRKGFPESYDQKTLLHFLMQLKSGKTSLKVPVYSHQRYDIIPNEYHTIDQSDIIIIEGLNLLNTNVRTTAMERLPVFVSDFLDFAIFVDAKPSVIEQWFLQRFTAFREQAIQHPDYFFHQFSEMPEMEAMDRAREVWREINAKNLRENILPYRNRARCILRKNELHHIDEVWLRRL